MVMYSGSKKAKSDTSITKVCPVLPEIEGIPVRKTKQRISRVIIRPLAAAVQDAKLQPQQSSLTLGKQTFEENSSAMAPKVNSAQPKISSVNRSKNTKKMLKAPSDRQSSTEVTKSTATTSKSSTKSEQAVIKTKIIIPLKSPELLRKSIHKLPKIDTVNSVIMKRPAEDKVSSSSKRVCVDRPRILGDFPRKKTKSDIRKEIQTILNKIKAEEKQKNINF